MQVITKTHNTFGLRIETNKLYRKITVFLEPSRPAWQVVLDPDGFDCESEAATVYQPSDDDSFLFSRQSSIRWNPGNNCSPDQARRFMQAIELAAVIAADITSWLE